MSGAFDELKKIALGGILNFQEYAQQRRRILENPGLVVGDPPPQALPIGPLAFALRGLVLTSLIISCMTWLVNQVPGIPQEPAEAELAYIREVAAKKKTGAQLTFAESFALSRTPLKRAEGKKKQRELAAITKGQYQLALLSVHTHSVDRYGDGITRLR
jgi:hypothetical protein